MTNQKIIPIGKKVLIKDRAVGEHYPGTTILRTEVVNDYIADVIAIGDTVENINIGDVVKYSEHATEFPMQHNGENHLLVNADMIFAKIVYE